MNESTVAARDFVSWKGFYPLTVVCLVVFHVVRRTMARSTGQPRT
jgi:hypothetical protein